MVGIERVAVVGSGMIGASWSALFLAHGLDVVAHDPSPEAEGALRDYVGQALSQLKEFGHEGQGRLRFEPDMPKAVEGADFVQENAPEREDLKRRLLAELDGLLPPEVIVASSTSALVRSAIVQECANKGRFIVAHPFNPPHLVPLVEIVGQDEAVVARARAFYAGLGRKPVVLRREMPGHIANRLSSALYREAVYLVEQGVAGVADIDAAISDGPDLRWAVMGPHMTYHLGGGQGGIAHYLSHLGPSQERRWASLGTPSLTPEVRVKIVEGVAEEAAGRSISDLERERDRLLLAILRAKADAAARRRTPPAGHRSPRTQPPGNRSHGPHTLRRHHRPRSAAARRADRRGKGERAPPLQDASAQPAGRGRLAAPPDGHPPAMRPAGGFAGVGNHAGGGAEWRLLRGRPARSLRLEGRPVAGAARRVGWTGRDRGCSGRGSGPSWPTRTR